MTEQRRKTKGQNKIEIRVFSILPDLFQVSALKRQPDTKHSNCDGSKLFYQTLSSIGSLIKIGVFDLIANLFIICPVSTKVDCTGTLDIYSIFCYFYNYSILNRMTAA
jgi:hypothetical protein